MSNKHAADSDFLKNLRKEANKSDVENDEIGRASCRERVFRAV